jgi:nicotinate dehydrogenase subunit A
LGFLGQIVLQCAAGFGVGAIRPLEPVFSTIRFPNSLCASATLASDRIWNMRIDPIAAALTEDAAAMNQKFSINVNGTDHTVEADEDMPLLYALRNDIGLNNPHFGCGLAQCGACTVHLNGQPIRSCITPISAVGDGKIVTLAGLGTPDKPHPLQTAYIEEEVPQCGYCINGWIMTAAAFLRDKKKPTEAEIKSALEGLKCRCGTHVAILRAVKRAAAMMG